jgi:hypothetical protein
MEAFFWQSNDDSSALAPAPRLRQAAKGRSRCRGSTWFCFRVTRFDFANARPLSLQA